MVELERASVLMTRLSYLSESDRTRIKQALDLATKAHEKQKRLDGSPYITHPIEVAHIVVDMGLDADSIIAALLHDCIEDTEYGFDAIKDDFGQSVAEMVDGVTKLTRVPYTSKAEQQVENLRKMLMAMSKDIRVILIKIADRLHNMRTIDFQRDSKQRDKALETMEVYAPIAHRLGMQKVKWELEDISLRILDPVGYEDIMQELQIRKDEREEFINQIQSRMADRLAEVGISAEVHGRVKHIYSIYRKMYTQHKTIDEVYDLYAMRVIVDSVADCYNVLGFIHDMYKPIPGRFKDYISTPKPNMYQSLHTTVIGREGVPFEVQIRTREMHRIAEYGIAAHWKYKSGVVGNGGEEELAWIRQLLENGQDTEAEDFISRLKVDLFSDEVYVFTPKGDVINLPSGATPIDFAYSIHSAVGNRMTGAKINGRIVPLDYSLQNGEIVEVITGGVNTGPKRGWLTMAKTGQARNKIKQWFKKERRDENIAEGREMFERELKRAKIPMTDFLREDVCPQVLRKLSFSSIEEMYAGIGYGGVTTGRVLNRIREELTHVSKEAGEKADQEVIERIAIPKKQIKASSGVIVEGVDGDCLVKFARCCSPIPGDEIVGYITRGYGVSIHRRDCKNATLDSESQEERARWVKVHWAETLTEKYQMSLQITAKNRVGLLVDTVNVTTNMKVLVSAVSARELGDGYAVVNMTLEVAGADQLDIIMNKMRAVSGVLDVRRSAN